jgi:hypothetical protein
LAPKTNAGARPGVAHAVACRRVRSVPRVVDDEDGLDWRTALSDNNSAYVEIQAGLFRNQETYAFLEPRQTIVFTEYWMPAREIGGISRGNLIGVLHIERKDGVLHVAFNPNSKIPGAALRIFDGANVVLDERTDLTPEIAWKRQVSIADATRKYRFELSNNRGLVLMAQQEGEYDWQPESEIKVGPQKSYAIPQEADRTVDDWLQFGINAELDGELLIAAKCYQEALHKFPDSLELRKASGRLLATLKRYRGAAAELAVAHARNTSDTETSFYLGISYEGLDRERALSTPTRKPCDCLRTGRSSMRRGTARPTRRIAGCAKHSTIGLRSAPEIFAPRKAYCRNSYLGQRGSANKLAREWLARFPLSDFLGEEIGKPHLEHLATIHIGS